MVRTNKAGQRIIVEEIDEWAFGCHGAYEGHCFGCRRSSKSVREADAHEWAEQHARSCSVG
ncbi:hypothetical protein [Streptomyces sp. NPDC093018]|uniref:hypothetical protein n=1 Tax=Streptomyces sp. NPDC093018 TaxID=3155067 RepID=UPI0034310779